MYIHIHTSVCFNVVVALVALHVDNGEIIGTKTLGDGQMSTFLDGIHRSEGFPERDI